MLVDALQELTETQLHRWLTHSRTLRLSIVERLEPEDDWRSFVTFIERYGADVFTQKFLNLGNLRAILHQRVAVWLSNLELDPEAEELKLVREMEGGRVQERLRRDAADVRTAAAEPAALDDRDGRAQLPGLERRGLARGPGPDDHEIEPGAARAHGLPCLASDGRRGPRRR